jgi:hypothetical protein
MTLKQLQQLLHQHGVDSDEIAGQPFDPHRQEALSQGHDRGPARPRNPERRPAGLPAGGAKVVRPAKVVVNDLIHRQSKATMAVEFKDYYRVLGVTPNGDRRGNQEGVSHAGAEVPSGCRQG